MGQKFVKRHNGIPIRNNYTRFHEATSIGRGKKIGEKFFVYFSKKNEKKKQVRGGVVQKKLQRQIAWDIRNACTKFH